MVNKAELISIGLPAYNGQKFISQAIESLLKQSYQNFELIISDDNSQDNTQAICLDFKKKDHRIKYFRQQANLGFVKNFNFVLEKAKGKFFMWAGNDDYWDKNYILKLYRLFIQYPQTVLAVSKFNNVYNNKPYNYLKNQKIKNGLHHIDYLIHFLNIRNISYFYGLHRTDNLKESGGYLADNRPFFKSSDFLTIFKALLGGPLSYIDQVLFFKRDTGNYTEQFVLIKSLRFDSGILKKIFRFLCFPLFYLYDLCFALWYCLKSILTIREKMIVGGYLLLNFIRYNLDYVFKVMKGLLSILTGITRKLYFNHAKS